MDFTTIMALIVMLVLILITVRRLLLGKPNECGFEIEILQTKEDRGMESRNSQFRYIKIPLIYPLSDYLPDTWAVWQIDTKLHRCRFIGHTKLQKTGGIAPISKYYHTQRSFGSSDAIMAAEIRYWSQHSEVSKEKPPVEISKEEGLVYLL